MIIQNQVINKILSTKDASIITENNLTADDFPSYEDEFNFIKNHLKVHGCIPDLTTFLGVFSKFDVFDVQEPKEYLLEELMNDKQRRIMTIGGNRVRECLVSDVPNIAEARKAVNEMYNQLNSTDYVDAVDIYKDTSRYEAYIDKLTNINNYYVTTGFKELDNILGGWDRKNEYATIIARTGVGKSWIMIKSAAASAMAGLNVGIYEGEMEIDKISYRIDSVLSSISNHKLTKGIDGEQLEYKKFLEDIRKEMPGSIKVLTAQLAGGAVGVGKLRAFIEKSHLDILFVDQHSLLEDDRGAKNLIDRASNISKDLKQLQVTTGIPIITVAQQNRESTEGIGVSTRNIAQSDRIGQDSTVIIAVERKDNIVTLNTIKSRDGGDNKKLSYLVDFDIGKFTYIANEEDGNPDNAEAYESLRDSYELSEEDKQTLWKKQSLFNKDVVSGQPEELSVKEFNKYDESSQNLNNQVKTFNKKDYFDDNYYDENTTF